MARRCRLGSGGPEPPTSAHNILKKPRRKIINETLFIYLLKVKKINWLINPKLIRVWTKSKLSKKSTMETSRTIVFKPSYWSYEDQTEENEVDIHIGGQTADGENGPPHCMEL